MDTDYLTKLQRSAKWAYLVLSAFYIMMICLMIFVISWVIWDLPSLGHFILDQSNYPAFPLYSWQIILLALFAVGQLFLMMMAFSNLQKVFASFRENQMSARKTIKPAKMASRWIWAALVWSVVIQVPASIVASYYAEPGKRMIAIELSSAHLYTLLAAVLTAFMAHAMKLGIELWQDHKEIV